MSDIDWSQAKNQAFSAADFLKFVEHGRAQKAAAIKFEQDQIIFDQQQRAKAEMRAALDRGDIAGAQRIALATGQTELASGVGTYNDKERKHQVDGTTAFANSMDALAATPVEERRAVVNANRQFFRSLGATDEQIDNADLSDAGIAVMRQSSMTYKDRLAADVAQQSADTGTMNAATQRMEAETPIVDGALVDRETGAVVYRAAQRDGFSTEDTVYETPEVSGGVASDGSSTQPSSAIWTSDQLREALPPGARFTSGERSPEHNRQVGGVTNSQHVSRDGRPSTAIDFVAPGMTKAQVEAHYRQKGANVTVLQHDAGNGMHFHVQANRRTAQRQPAPTTRVVQTGVPKPSRGNGGGVNGDKWPAPASTSLSSLVAADRQIDQALGLLDDNNKSPEAVNARQSLGLKNYAPDMIVGRLDPDGAAYRALIGQIGGIIIKDTSGAAVSLSEDARLSKWIPLPTDTVAQVKAKLRNLKNDLTNRQQALRDTYSPENGYRDMSTGNGSSTAGYTAVGKQKSTGKTIYRRPDGKLVTVD